MWGAVWPPSMLLDSLSSALLPSACERTNPGLKTSPTYLELSASLGLCAVDLITSPRERDVLNAMQEGQNMFVPDTVLDLSQSLGRNACRTDGLVPALGTGCSRMYVPASSVFLDARQCLALQGHDTSGLPAATLESFSDDDLRTLAGNAMCVPVVGSVVASALSLLAR